MDIEMVNSYLYVFPVVNKCTIMKLLFYEMVKRLSKACLELSLTYFVGHINDRTHYHTACPVEILTFLVI